ncbi:MAG: GNAT family N-acetyltransferase [Jatrophihabitantaceae bacterium]
MSRRLVNLTLDNLGDLAPRCRACVFWELDAASARQACTDGSAELEKEVWVSDTLLEWGCCGQLVYVDGVAAGHLLYAPPAYVPRSMGFATSPVAPDAVLLMSAHVEPYQAGVGLGRILVQGVARDVSRRGIRAVEAFGRTAAGADVAQFACLPPVDFLLAVGFKTVRPHRLTPRLRLDIRSIVSWKEDVEYAIERLLGSISVPVLGGR